VIEGGRADWRTGGQEEGATLIELLVVLLLLGLLLSVSAVSLSSIRPAPGSAWLDSVRSARARSIRSGRTVLIVHDSGMIRFLPDGRILGGMLDPLTGELPDAR
jgi:hypothetical protein